MFTTQLTPTAALTCNGLKLFGDHLVGLPPLSVLQVLSNTHHHLEAHTESIVYFLCNQLCRGRGRCDGEVGGRGRCDGMEMRGRYAGRDWVVEMGAVSGAGGQSSIVGVR